MPDERILDALDACIARLRAGASVDQCLASYPELASNLRPLLTAAARLREAAPEHFPDGARVLTRGRLMAGMRRTEAAMQPRARSRLTWGRALLVPGMAIAIVLGLMAGLKVSQAPDSAEAATILTVIQGEVRIQNARDDLVVRSGAYLRPGDRISTSAGAKAVLTFLDGSTVTLDSNTQVIINSVQDDRGAVRVKLTQETGKTWTNVPESLGESRIEIITPTAGVQTEAAAFSTSVEPSTGRTEVGTASGSILVSSGSQRTEVSGGSTAAVSSAGVVAPAEVAPLPVRELVVRISGPAFGHVTDPGGSTVGVLAPGYPVNQITGATAVRDGSTLIIKIPNPTPGGYLIGVHGGEAGRVQVGVTLAGNNDSTSFAVAQGQDFQLKLSVEPQALALGQPAHQEPAAARPANVAVPDRVAAAAAATARPEPSSTATPKPPAPTRTPTPRATNTPRPVATPISNVATPVRASDVSPADASPATAQ